MIVGTIAKAIQGSMVHITAMPAKNHPIAIISTDIDSVSVRSTTSVSYVNLLRIRPIGVVSKYDMGALKRPDSIAENTFLAQRAPPVTAHSDLKNVKIQDTRRRMA
mmetsp:Transcript_32959/g.75934  ORF Transcript_32959/g.75934 Transcript_32959/m.75934 type:complete len:106 (-) Transcript_32959:789-1106(-)